MIDNQPIPHPQAPLARGACTIGCELPLPRPVAFLGSLVGGACSRGSVDGHGGGSSRGAVLGNRATFGPSLPIPSIASHLIAFIRRVLLLIGFSTLTHVYICRKDPPSVQMKTSPCVSRIRQIGLNCGENKANCGRNVAGLRRALSLFGYKPSKTKRKTVAKSGFTPIWPFSIRNMMVF